MNQNGGSRTETLVKLVLIFVISLLSFSVGTFVGKQFSDSQYQMANLEKETNGVRSTASVDPVTNENTLTDEDIASLTEEFVSAERENAKETEEAPAKDPMKAMTEKVAIAAKNIEQPVKKAQEAAKAKREIAAHQPDVKKTSKPDAIAKAANRIAADLAPSKAVDSSKRMPNALPSLTAATTIGKYTVQVASYSTQKEAEDHAQTLKDKGYEAFYLEAKVKGKSWYRVSVGLFGSRGSAKDYRVKFMKQAKVNTAIVQKIIK